MEIPLKSSGAATSGGFAARLWTAASVCVVVAACGSAQGDTGDGAQTSRTVAAEAPAVEAPQEARPPRGMAWVIFGADTALAEVARDPDTRAQGLMYREELGEDEGMLFIWDNVETRSFWMSNTYIALDIAYLDPSLNIIDIQQMEPLTTESHVSTRPAMFALEMAQGWFAGHGIAVGAQAQVVFGLP